MEIPPAGKGGSIRQILRHQNRLERNQRSRMPYKSLANKDPARRRDDREVCRKVRERLQRGQSVAPEDLGDGGKA